jgi:NAD(P)-dependent dehydrogenase (short-subunit alcohol dehydrogenase family)
MINNQPSVLVTGASSGIGLAITQYIASKGMHVFAGARKQEALEGLANNPNVTPLKLDVTDTADIEQAKKIIEGRTAGLFGLVNNAGVGNGGPLMDVSVEDLRAQFEVNLFGVHQITQAVFPLLLEAKGRIVMMSSDSGFFATPFFGSYCSSKFALEGYSDSLRREIAPYGVKVIIIEPGRITTPIWDKGEKYLDKYAGSLFAAEAKAIGEYAILKGKTSGLAPIEVAKTVYQVLTVASPQLRYIVAENKLEYQLMKILPASYVDKLALKKVRKVVGLAHSAMDHSK